MYKIKIKNVRVFYSEVLPIVQDFESHVDTRCNEKGAIKVFFQFLIA